MVDHPTLPGMHVSFQPRGTAVGKCKKCGSRIKVRFAGQEYGPVCMRKLGLIAPGAAPQTTTTTKPKRLKMSKTKPYARVPGNRCDRAPRCDNQATLAVGEHGQWRLCDHCAIRAEFEQFSKRVPLKAVS